MHGAYSVKEINVFRSTNSVNMRYFCKLCVVEKNVANCFVKKKTTIRLPCERTKYRIVEKLRKTGSVLDKKKKKKLGDTVAQTKTKPREYFRHFGLENEVQSLRTSSKYGVQWVPSKSQGLCFPNRRALADFGLVIYKFETVDWLFSRNSDIDIMYVNSSRPLQEENTYT